MTNIKESRAYPLIYKNYILPVLNIKNGREGNPLAHLKFLRKSQWWGEDRLMALERRNIKNIVRHAYENVPYYHRLFKNMGIFPDDVKNANQLKKIPILTKEEIRKDPNRFIAKGYENRVLPYRTGGSTGEPLKFFIDKKVRKSWAHAAFLRGNEWCGVQLGEENILIWGSYFDISKQENLKGKILNVLARTTLLNAFDLKYNKYPKFVKIIREKKPTYLRGYATAVFMLARYILNERINDIKLKAVFTTAETLDPYQRKIIERAFNCEVFDYYGNRETSIIAYECPAHSGYHNAMETTFVEICENGKNVGVEETGDIIITDFTNYAMPFIRYKIEDNGILTDETCSCGRKLQLIKEIKGRTHDVIVTPDGRHIHGEIFSHIFWGLKWIRKFQVRQKKEDLLEVLIVTGENYNKGEMISVRNLISYHLGEDMKIEIKIVNSIPISQSGKLRFVTSDVYRKLIGE